MSLFRSLRVHQIMGANTEIGKTIFSTLLCRASLALGEHTTYLKPIGTAEPGSLNDAEFVARFADDPTGDARISASCLYRFEEPVSPHLAAERAPKNTFIPSDEDLATSIRQALQHASTNAAGRQSAAYVETAGGVHSPVLSGSTQINAYRPLRLPSILVASHLLGGISSTISAYESLILHGFDIDAVLCFEEEYYGNSSYLRKWFEERGIHSASITLPPPKCASKSEDEAALLSYFGRQTQPATEIIQNLQTRHAQRLAELDSAGERTLKSVWWPFVQHSFHKDPKDVMIIDSAHRDTFQVAQPGEMGLTPVLDGSASWWSQGFGHADEELALAAAYAAGRYGHVMFPTATHAPALTLAERLIHKAGDGWATRCFFSDNGTTAIEIALKMALRLHNKRSGGEKRRELGVLGLQGSYHGDTIGAMDASPGNVFNEKVDWYRGRGLWLDPPSVAFENGRPTLSFNGSQWQHASGKKTFDAIEDVYDLEARLDRDPLASAYAAHIRNVIQSTDVELGALIIEPAVLGAAGMCFVDPLFQRIMVEVARTDLGLPVIFDEVFAGMGRLGHYSAGPSMVGVQPDIAAYAKILSGGLVPLSATLASDETFRAFEGPQKVDALLHGHSYTAHATGCCVANKALDIMDRLHVGKHMPQKWSSDFASTLSEHPRVQGAMTIGTVLAVYLRDLDGGGYESSAATKILRHLRHPAGLGQSAIHARPLGNVLYLIASLTTPEVVIDTYKSALIDALE